MCVLCIQNCPHKRRMYSEEGDHKEHILSVGPIRRRGRSCLQALISPGFCLWISMHQVHEVPFLSIGRTVIIHLSRLHRIRLV